MTRISRVILWLSIAFLLNVVLGKAAQAQSINAASCNSSDVQAALNKVAADGTTVNVPAGTCTWTTPVTYNQVYSTTLKGAGSQSVVGGGDVTVIVDSISRNFTTCSPDPATLNINTAATKSFRLSGFTLQPASPSTNQTCGGYIRINGSSQSFRWDHTHIKVEGQNTVSSLVGGWVYGVIDHNIWDQTGTNNGVKLKMDSYGNTANSEGDGAWADATNFGSNHFIFLEDNIFNGGIFGDCSHGGKYVFRHNIMNASSLQTHPTGSQGDGRGCRASEIYQNTFNGNSNCGANFSLCLFNADFLSSGTALIWGNKAPVINSGSGSGYQWLITLHSMRKNNSTYSQAATPNGWGYCGTAFNGTGSAWDLNSNAATGYACLDQPGRGKGDLLKGQSPNKVNSTTGTISWPHQTLEPIYEWLDTFNSVPNNPGGLMNNYDPTVLVQNQDFYIYTTSFNGTSGVGSGLLSARPATCTAGPGGNTPGVAYWATDQNTLYVCNPTNTWIAYYKPYPYPHPLTSGSVTSPAAPTNLTAIIN